VYGEQNKDDLLKAATTIEGHPDNAAAALLGGLTVGCQIIDGAVRAVSCPWPHDWRFLVLTPELGLATREARQVLPAGVPLRDAVANMQRVAMIVAAAHNG